LGGNIRSGHVFRGEAAMGVAAEGHWRTVELHLGKVWAEPGWPGLKNPVVKSQASAWLGLTVGPIIST
jgi:hypothetical protein